MRHLTDKTWKATVVLGVFALVGSAFAADMSLPPEQHIGAVGYVSGGIGEGQAKMFESQMGKFPLTVELLERAGHRNEFTANAEVKVIDARGHQILDTKASGPFLLLDLPSGKYSIEADLAGRTVKQTAVKVAAGHHGLARLEFPAGTD